ncbi:MAG: DNA-directed RNA polymerase subunit omega [Acidobacteriota bacterium]|jgi:DNA-directed RNA polymerase subunit omega|nr:DNA-directed RNA polymerase subunit omega [Acidobacteriota bacterium]MDQ3372432.1 DNA-directed RNA polymerase subunit omega [Acidobacteriota bacterium]
MVEQTEKLVEETTEEPKVTPEIDSKYRKIILAAQRSKQLQRGANPRVEMDPRKSKTTRIAMREIEEGKIDFELIPMIAANKSQAD